MTLLHRVGGKQTVLAGLKGAPNRPCGRAPVVLSRARDSCVPATMRESAWRGFGVEPDAVPLREGEHERNASEAVLAQASQLAAVSKRRRRRTIRLGSRPEQQSEPSASCTRNRESKVSAGPTPDARNATFPITRPKSRARSHPCLAASIPAARFARGVVRRGCSDGLGP
jgi:hypothetical protein